MLNPGYGNEDCRSLRQCDEAGYPHMFKARLIRPITNPSTPSAVGVDEGLKIFQEIGELYIPVITDVHEPEQAAC